jgi:DnaJ-class molecular chaperone
MPTHYETLGIRATATASEIRQAYHTLARQLHPDKNPGDIAAEESFKRVHAAYEVLHTPRTRREYDQSLDRANARRWQTAPLRRRERRRARNTEYVLKIPLRQAFTGGTRTLRIKRKRRCRPCKGYGTLTSKEAKMCMKCYGKKETVKVEALGPGLIRQELSPCTNCKGRGVCIPPAGECVMCGGDGFAWTHNKVCVSVPRGVCDGHVITFHEQGDDGPTEEWNTGHVVITCSLEERDAATGMRRIGDTLDLEMTYVLTLDEALHGYCFCVTHMDGKPTQWIRSPLFEGPVQNNDVHVAKGLGLRSDESGRAGDLCITFRVALTRRPTRRHSR